MKVLLLVLLLCGNCNAASVALRWDANPVTDEVVKYTVYWGNYSGNQSKFAFKNRTSVTETSATVRNVSHLEKWYFRVTASNESMESLYSNKVYVNFVRTPSNVKFQSVDIR